MLGKKNLKKGETRIIEIREAKAEVFIDASLKKIWDCITDVNNRDRWVNFFTNRLPDHLDRIEKVGDYGYYEARILGIPFKGKIVIVEQIPLQRIVFYLLSEYRGSGEYLLESVDDGIQVHYTILSEIPSSYLGKMVDRSLLAQLLQEQMQEHLDRLKAYVEGAPLS